MRKKAEIELVRREGAVGTAYSSSALGRLSFEELIFLIPDILLTSFLFVFRSRRSNPLMHLGPLKITNVPVANLEGMVSCIVILLLFFAVDYYTQLIPGFRLNQTILFSGLTLTPETIGMLIGGCLRPG